MDRTFKGLIAGICGALVMNTLNLTLYRLKLTSIRFLDWASIIMTGSRPDNWNGLIYSLFIQILWTGTLGIGLAFIFPIITLKGYFIKATLYSFILGFFFRAIVVLFRIPELYNISTQSSEMYFFTVISWGLTTAFILHKLDNFK
jgi:hypothetical protein